MGSKKEKSLVVGSLSLRALVIVAIICIVSVTRAEPNEDQHEALPSQNFMMPASSSSHNPDRLPVGTTKTSALSKAKEKWRTRKSVSNVNDELEQLVIDVSGSSDQFLRAPVSSPFLPDYKPGEPTRLSQNVLTSHSSWKSNAPAASDQELRRRQAGVQGSACALLSPGADKEGGGEDDWREKPMDLTESETDDNTKQPITSNFFSFPQPPSDRAAAQGQSNELVLP